MIPIVWRLQWVWICWLLRRFLTSLVKLLEAPNPSEWCPAHQQATSIVAWQAWAAEYIDSLLDDSDTLRMCTIPMNDEPKVTPDRSRRPLSSDAVLARA